MLLDPDEREVALLDDRVMPEDLRRVVADPRWRTERLPTDRTVMGGWAVAALCALAGFAAGLGAALLASRLLT